MSTDFIFVDENLECRTGEQARSRLGQINDLPYLEAGKGVVQVPKSRWRQAQQYERKTWMEAGAHAVQDRNEEHCASFLDYQAIHAKSFRRAVELGCGPFTNLRLIARVANIESCVLLDPLIESYLHHRHCTYRHHLLATRASRLSLTLGGSLAGRAARRAIRHLWPRALVGGVAVERLIQSPIEEMPECGAFGLVVMINVIEHCFDVMAIFRAILRLCPPGGLFVFHDRLYEAHKVASTLEARFDAGHPLRVPGEIIEDFLRRHFAPLFERRVEIKDSLGAIDLSESGLYFIGERRQATNES